MAELSQSSLNRISIADIRGSRCRLQRLRDLKFFSGWITGANTSELGVEIKGESPMLPGDTFYLEAALESSKVSLPCRLKKRDLASCLLEITGAPVLTSPGQEPRYRAQDLVVTLKHERLVIEAQAIDISHSGIGILTQTAIPSLSRVKFSAQGRNATVSGIGLVRYCRPDSEDRDSFRIGFQIEFESRLARALWQRLVFAAMDNAKQAA